MGGSIRSVRRGRDVTAEPPENTIDLGDPDPLEVARTIVLNKLTNAPRTRAQLAEVLAERNVPADVAVQALDRFEEVGLIDDREFAVMWVRSRHRGRGLGRRVLKQELVQRGVNDENVELALAEIDDDAEYEAALDLVQRRWAAARRLDAAARHRRLFGLLMRRGYSPGLAERVIGEVSAGDHEE